MTIPAWAVDGLVSLLLNAVRLLAASSDDERREALLKAVEDAKAAHDKARWPEG